MNSGIYHHPASPDRRLAVRGYASVCQGVKNSQSTPKLFSSSIGPRDHLPLPNTNAGITAPSGAPLSGWLPIRERPSGVLTLSPVALALVAPEPLLPLPLKELSPLALLQSIHHRSAASFSGFRERPPH